MARLRSTEEQHLLPLVPRGDRRRLDRQRLYRFIDNGASFNAVDPPVVERRGFTVTVCAKPLELTVGNNQKLQEQHATVSTDEALVLVAYMNQRPSIQVQFKRVDAEDPVFGLLVTHRCRDGASGAPPVELNHALRANFEHFAPKDGRLYYESGPEEPQRFIGMSRFHADLGYEPRALADRALPDGLQRKR
ncbi:hypothetical protein PINS_up016405 [Pythium insidiosum]|nr:hypothetical protein PINS_up016405 [Pythium insidiosum]